MNFGVIIVDDNEMDRYIASRVLLRSDRIEAVEESISGNAFLETYYSGEVGEKADQLPICVLMDINMPGLSGFETIIEMEKRIDEGQGPECIVVMMLTSSSNPEDQENAKNLKSVKGYAPKPLDNDGVAKIIQKYESSMKAR